MSTPGVPGEWGHRAAIPAASWAINFGAVLLGLWVRSRSFGFDFGPPLTWGAVWALAEGGLLVYVMLALDRGWVKPHERGGIGFDVFLPPIVATMLWTVVVLLAGSG